MKRCHAPVTGDVTPLHPNDSFDLPAITRAASNPRPQLLCTQGLLVCPPEIRLGTWMAYPITQQVNTYPMFIR